MPRLPVELSARKPRAAGRMEGALTLRLVVCTLPLIALALTPQLSLAGGGPFPAIPGWRLTGEPIVYTPTNLWDFIDGAAESYLAYSFVDLHVGEYAGPESVTVRVELYCHADPDNAFGIYATERAPDYSFLTVGAQGYEAEGILNFLTGRYYVKLSTHQKGSAAATALRSIAGHIDTYLAERSVLPAGLKRLPSEGKQPNTEGYVGENFLGYGLLRHAFTGRYDKGLQIFVMEYPTADSAAGTLRRFLAVAPGTQTGQEQYRISDPNNGPIAIARTGALLYGILGAPDAAMEARYLKLLESSILEH
jgi:hypothetical protein